MFEFQRLLDARCQCVDHQEVREHEQESSSRRRGARAAVVACEQRRVRMWLTEVQQRGLGSRLLEQTPSTYRVVAAERPLPSLKMGRSDARFVHRAGDPKRVMRFMRCRVQNGDYSSPWEQIAVCRVEVLS